MQVEYWILIAFIFFAVIAFGTMRTYAKFEKMYSLAKSNEMQLSLIFNFSTNYIILINSKLEIIRFNRSFQEAYKRLFGTEIKEGDLYLEYTSKEHHDKMLERIKKALAGETVTHHRVANIENKPIFLTITYSPIMNGNVVENILITIIDNTEQKNYEAKLLENSLKFKELSNSTTVMLWTTDENDNVNFYNDALIKYMGVQPNEDLEQAWRNRIHPDSVEEVEKQSKASIQNTVSYTLNFRLRKADGSYGWVKEIAHPRFNIKGEFEGFIGSCVDITELKEAENKLLSEKKFNQKLTELSPDIIYLYDLHKKQNVFENRSVLKQLGYSIENNQLMTDEDFVKYMHPDDKILYESYHSSLMNLTSDMVHETHFRLRDAQGKYRWYISKDIVFSKDDKSGTTLILGNLRDETARKEDELSIKKTNAELDNFVYRASHDLKAPLTSIQGLIDLLNEENKDPTLQKYINHIDLSTQRLLDVIQDLVNHSRNSRMALQVGKVNFKSLIAEVIDTLKFMKNADNISFNYEVNVDENFASDEFRIKVVLNNLISNSIKYHDFTKPNPFIYILVTSFNNHCVIMVNDNGMGIDSNYHEKIFDMFFRATKSGSGSGLGLYIVKEAIEKIGGTIKVKSTPGQGSNFEITLPNLGSK